MVVERGSAGATEVTLRLGRGAVTLRAADGRVDAVTAGPVDPSRVARVLAGFECARADVEAVHGRDLQDALEWFDRLHGLTLPQSCSPTALAVTSADERWELRLAVAVHPRAAESTLRRLSRDTDRMVARAALRRLAGDAPACRASTGTVAP